MRCRRWAKRVPVEGAARRARNLCNLSGFEYQSSEEVREELRKLWLIVRPLLQGSHRLRHQAPRAPLS